MDWQKQVAFVCSAFNSRNTYISYSDEELQQLPVVSSGFGRSYFFFAGNLFILDRYEVEASQTEKRKERIVLTVLGRSKKPINKLIETVYNEALEDDSQRVMTYSYSGWQRNSMQAKRSFDSIVLEESIKKELIGVLESFLQNKEWYHKNGIPWRLGVLLYGPPGTGKTTLVKAIASYLDSDIYPIVLSKMDDDTLSRALTSIPALGVVALEDIDVAGAQVDRGSAKTGPKIGEIAGRTETVNEDGETEETYYYYAPKLDGGGGGSFSDTKKESTLNTLSGLLNAIDGVASGDGRVLIATTNNIDALDPALIRSGRFDVRLEIGYLSDSTFTEYMRKLYPDHKIPDLKVKPNTPPCDVQAEVLKSRNDPAPVIKKFQRKRKSGKDE